MPPVEPGDLFWPAQTFTFKFPLRELLGAWWKNKLYVSVWVKDKDGTITFEDTKGELFQKVRRNLSVSVYTQ